MNKTEFLGRISARLGRTSGPVQAPLRSVVGVPEFWSQFHLSADECTTRFQEQLTQLGGDVRVVSDIVQLRSTLDEILQEMSPRRIGMWNDVNLNDYVDSAVSPYDVVRWGIDPPEVFTDTDVGITGCTFAIADTGTLVLSCNGTRGRSVHLLPPVHIAVVCASQICTRLGEVLEKVRLAPETDSYVHFVTGPSRSSDIENDQSIGVHGPAAVIAIVIENL